jgi:hypothetical protein
MNTTVPPLSELMNVIGDAEAALAGVGDPAAALRRLIDLRQRFEAILRTDAAVQQFLMSTLR